jgi:hypothetical protein
MSMTSMENSFTDEEAAALAILAEMVIPASDEYNLPGANDDRIIADILATGVRQYEPVAAALAALDAVSNDLCDQAFADLSVTAREDAVTAFRRRHGSAAGVFATITTQCYYRDDRVMRALDMETRPPFPLGFEVEEGDWSLLEPVRGRDPIYRQTS